MDSAWGELVNWADFLMTFAAFVGFGLGCGGGVALGAMYVLHKFNWGEPQPPAPIVHRPNRGTRR